MSLVAYYIYSLFILSFEAEIVLFVHFLTKKASKVTKNCQICSECTLFIEILGEFRLNVE